MIQLIWLLVVVSSFPLGKDIQYFKTLFESIYFSNTGSVIVNMLCYLHILNQYWRRKTILSEAGSSLDITQNNHSWKDVFCLFIWMTSCLSRPQGGGGVLLSCSHWLRVAPRYLRGPFDAHLGFWVFSKLMETKKDK